MSTERFKNVTSFVINLLNNKTIILLNLAEYRLILATASSAKYQTIFRAISQNILIICDIRRLSFALLLHNTVDSSSMDWT